MEEREIDLLFVGSASKQILGFASGDLDLVVSDEYGRSVNIATVEEAIF